MIVELMLSSGPIVIDTEMLCEMAVLVIGSTIVVCGGCSLVVLKAVGLLKVMVMDTRTSSEVKELKVVGAPLGAASIEVEVEDDVFVQSQVVDDDVVESMLELEVEMELEAVLDIDPMLELVEFEVKTVT